MIRSKIVISASIAGVAVAAGVASLVSMFPEAEVSPPPCDMPLPPSTTIEAEDVPDYYEGTFQWDGSDEAQEVALDVQRVTEQYLGHRKAAGTTIVATGRGTYTTGRDAHFTFRIEVDPRTGRFTMSESEPSVDNFATAGQHEALVGSLDHIRARWTGYDGSSGTLILDASPMSMRPVEVAATADRPAPAPTSVSAAPDAALRLEKGVRMMPLRQPRAERRCVESDQDLVKVHYTGWNVDGQFDSSRNRDRPALFRPRQLINGWRIALDQMCEGDYMRVWIPANEAYGDGGGGRPVGDLLFDIEVLEVRR